MKRLIFSCFILLLVVLFAVEGGEYAKKPIPAHKLSYAEVSQQVLDACPDGECEDKNCEEGECIDNIDEEKSDQDSSQDECRDERCIDKMMQYSKLSNVIEYNLDEEDDASICVIGNASLSLSPDSAKICVKIEKLSEEITQSKTQCFETFEKAVEALKGIEISEDEICLNYFNCYPEYNFESGRKLTGYFSDISFCVTVKSLDNINNVVNSLLESGVTSIYEINYQVTDLENAYSQALSQALDNAKTKASKLLGRDDLKIARINEERIFTSNNMYRSYAEEYSTSPLIGKINIEARVVVEFQG